MDKVEVTQQLESLKQQKADAIADVHSLDGAIRLCEYWLKKLDEKKKQAKKPVKNNLTPKG